MIERIILAWIVVLAVLPASIAAAGRTFDPAGDVLVALGADLVDCDDAEKLLYENHVAVRCARTTMSLKEIKSEWKRRAAGHELTGVLWDGVPWKKRSASVWEMFAFYESAPLSVTYDSSAGTLTLAWLTRYPECDSGWDVTWFAETEGGAARPIVWAEVEYPEEARIEHTAGIVTGSVLIGTTAELADFCITAVRPGGVDFESSVRDAVQRSEFRPAKLEGEPVPVAAMFFIRFSLGHDGPRWFDTSKRFFDAARTTGGRE